MEVVQVTRPAPADRAGFRDGDILLRVEDHPLPNAMTLQRVLRQLTPHAPVAAVVGRGNELHTLTVKPEAQ